MKTLTFMLLTLITLTPIIDNANATPPSVTTKKATIKVTSKKETSQKDKSTSKLIFTTLPADGLKINADGPWKLVIKSVTGGKVATTEFQRPEWKEEIAGFEIPLQADKFSKDVEVAFKMTTFVCTKDKSTCYREVVEDKAKVSL
jgi:hypothetical protein